jgi:hypothetical protein
MSCDAGKLGHLELNSTKDFSRIERGFMKITIDRTKCDGYAKCVQAAPKVFRLK